ncbi:MarR family winged helix-turn-helix transcriptional regulator [Niabella aurantiaca]|uniref:MarR family winged helix-turn-helix transcriptional regulator n=1 Tax=Niabella aurantiaca TaxID=379900 RepID=UPI00035F8F4F|nr:MarR family transcriptional regulator [Niabella aurantiaca]
MEKNKPVFHQNRKIAHLLAHHINNTGKYMNRVLQQKLLNAGHRLTSEQWVVLVCLFDRDGQTPTEICEATLKDKPGITRILKNMERNKLVINVDNPEDRRSKRVFLTKSVKKIEKQLLDIAAETERQCCNGISEGELEQCRMVLNKIMNNPE